MGLGYGPSGNYGKGSVRRVTPGGLVLNYRPTAAVVGSSRYNRFMSMKGAARAVAKAKETGYVDIAAAAYALDTTGSVTLLNTVAQGTTVNQRVGKKILLKSLQVRGYSAANSTATFNDVAWMIVYDKRPTGALPAITDILVSASAQSLNNDNNSGRFAILKRVDQVLLGNFSLTGAVANALTDISAVSEDCFLDLHSKETVYKAAATGAIADIEQGALYLVTVGSNAAGTTAAAATLAFRLRFWDS